MLQGVEAVGATVAVLALAIGNSRIEIDQPHAHRDLPRRRIGIGHDDEQPAARRQPLAYLPEYRLRLGEMFEGMDQEDVVEATLQGSVFEPTQDECCARIGNVLAGDFDQVGGPFKHGHVIEDLQQLFGELAVIASHFQRISRAKLPVERLEHVVAVDVVEIVGVQAVFRVLVLGVQVA
ncbi:hypothetical protein D3C81_1255090 [compost metagenome]